MGLSCSVQHGLGVHPTLVPLRGVLAYKGRISKLAIQAKGDQRGVRVYMFEHWRNVQQYVCMYCS